MAVQRVVLGRPIGQIDINWDRIVSSIEQAAVSTLNMDIDRAFSVSERRVPVRRVFKGGSRRYRELPGLTEEDKRQGILEGTPQWETHETIKAARALGIYRSRNKMLTGGSATELSRLFGEHYQPSMRVQVNRPWANRALPLPGSLARQFRSTSQRQAAAQRYDLRAAVLRPETDIGRLGKEFLSSAGRAELRSGRAIVEVTNPQTGETREQLGGRLKKELEVEYAKPEQSPRFVARVHSPTSYARFQEFGTRRHAAQPYLRPGLMQVRPRFRDDLIRTLQRAGRFGQPAGGQTYEAASGESIQSSGALGGGGILPGSLGNFLKNLGGD